MPSGVGHLLVESLRWRLEKVGLVPLPGIQGLGQIMGSPSSLGDVDLPLCDAQWAGRMSGTQHEFCGRRVALSSRLVACLVLYLFVLLWTLFSS